MDWWTVDRSDEQMNGWMDWWMVGEWMDKWTDG